MEKPNLGVKRPGTIKKEPVSMKNQSLASTTATNSKNMAQLIREQEISGKCYQFLHHGIIRNNVETCVSSLTPHLILHYNAFFKKHPSTSAIHQQSKIRRLNDEILKDPAAPTDSAHTEMTPYISECNDGYFQWPPLSNQE